MDAFSKTITLKYDRKLLVEIHDFDLLYEKCCLEKKNRYKNLFWFIIFNIITFALVCEFFLSSETGLVTIAISRISRMLVIIFMFVFSWECFGLKFFGDKYTAFSMCAEFLDKLVYFLDNANYNQDIYISHVYEECTFDSYELFFTTNSGLKKSILLSYCEVEYVDNSDCCIKCRYSDGKPLLTLQIPIKKCK